MFVLVFERADWSDVPSYIELKAKTLDAAKKETPTVIMEFLASDEGGAKEFSDFEAFDGMIRNLRLLEVKKAHKIDPTSKPFHDEFRRIEKEDDERRQIYSEQQERAEYERLNEKFGKKTDNRIKDKHSESAMYCEHANEMPGTCPCELNCYCKFNSCKSENRNAVHRVVYR